MILLFKEPQLPATLVVHIWLGVFTGFSNKGFHKEIEIIHKLFLVNCYLLHVPRPPSQPASNVGGLVIFIELA